MPHLYATLSTYFSDSSGTDLFAKSNILEVNSHVYLYYKQKKNNFSICVSWSNFIAQFFSLVFPASHALKCKLFDTGKKYNKDFISSHYKWILECNLLPDSKRRCMRQCYRSSYYRGKVYKISVTTQDRSRTAHRITWRDIFAANLYHSNYITLGAYTS